MFKIGDKVKFKKSSIDTGMIDATGEDVFAVVHVFPFASSSCVKTEIRITGYPGGWNADHFEHVKEIVMTNTDDAMNNTEEQEIKWEVGQEVWCILQGSGTVYDYAKEEYPVKVLFSSGEEDSYTQCGRMRSWDKNRTLFFSEPIVTAELFPPKKLFVPTLKKGDMVVVNTELGPLIHSVYGESETHLYCNGQDYTKKKIASVFKLGEEIKFN